MGQSTLSVIQGGRRQEGAIISPDAPSGEGLWLKGFLGTVATPGGVVNLGARRPI